MIITIAKREEKTITKGKNEGNKFLQLTDENGKKHNVFGFHAQWAICLVGYQIDLGYQDDDRTKNIEYVKPGEPLPESVEPKTASLDKETQKDIKDADKPPTAPQERGMWWKELGEMLRCGDIDKNTLEGKALRVAYYAEMFRVLDLSVKKESK